MKNILSLAVSLLFAWNLSLAEGFKPVSGAVKTQEAPEVPADPEPTRAAPAGETVSGVVGFARPMGESTEVFLVGEKQSFFIPHSQRHNGILGAVVASQKNRSPISLKVDRGQRTILDVAEAGGSARGPASTGASAGTGTDAARGAN